MAPKKGENSKAAAARERKADAASAKEAEKDRQRQLKEDEEWSVGAKANDKAKKEEEKRQRLLEAKKAREEAEKNDERELAKLRGMKQSHLVERGPEKKIAAKEKAIAEFKPPTAAEEYQARNIDDALDLLEITTGGSSSAAAGSAAVDAAIDRHPERRMKAAYAAYEEKWIPLMKEENPGLRLSQLKERIFKQWQKAPENPMNQGLAYDASKEEQLEHMRQQQELRLASMRLDSDSLSRRDA
eukprot:Unigene4934_Nuclearia_a/m.15113 Unigene4934_Nuclearia_a/g.15113  ORF Unigene4934_Nuclearia_a/g.15113 Unigene4934_Nuclearia_a/m.15113 type:complete len:243 (-) Unigene4934_Nuclearia_a:63-791(-)